MKNGVLGHIQYNVLDLLCFCFCSLFSVWFFEFRILFCLAFCFVRVYCDQRVVFRFVVYYWSAHCVLFFCFCLKEFDARVLFCVFVLFSEVTIRALCFCFRLCFCLKRTLNEKQRLGR